MPRQARKESSTDYYHLMMRGNNRENIFSKYEEKEYFAKLLKSFSSDPEVSVEIAAYCIMSNHVHIVVQGKISEISASIKKINIQYAMVYNKKADRIGHVFQDRFKSEVIQDDIYLLQVIRYVHNNPVTANIVSKPEDYRWSSYREFSNNNRGIVAKDQKQFILALFGDNRKSFEEFHQKSDFREYLDTEQDIEHKRSEAVRVIINEYCIASGIDNIDHVLSAPDHKEELAKRLLAETALSIRHIANLLGLKKNYIEKIRMLNKK